MRALVRIRGVDGGVFARDQRDDAVQFARNCSGIFGEGIPLRVVARAFTAAPDR